MDEQNLPGNPLLKDVVRRLSAVQAGYLGVMDEKDPISVLYKAQQKLLQTLQKVGDSEDPETILRAERLVLDNERTYYADTPLMQSSLDNALGDIDIALKLVDTVQAPEAYKGIADGYTRPRNRIGNLPKDEARQFFKSHQTRLNNQETAISIGLYKVLIEVRKNNLNVASGEYIKLQKIALDGPLSGQESVPEVNRNTENRR